jgi:hypothetical protein
LRLFSFLTAAKCVLDHKDIKIARPDIPSNLDVGEKTRLEAELHSVGTYQTALGLTVDVLQVRVLFLPGLNRGIPFCMVLP